MLERLKSFLDISDDYPSPLRSIMNLGLLNFIQLRRDRRTLARLPDNTRMVFRSRHARYPLICRAGTTDLKVFSQIFLFREYSCLDRIREARLIIDCGANCGYSSAYFLSRYPTARVVAVEPDPGNFALLQENLRPYGDRASCLCSAIWSHPARLVMSEVPYRDGLQWARQVRATLPSETAGFLATDIGTLLEQSGEERISILKIDIEGAEGVVFSRGYEAWIDRVDALVIELHADSIFGDNDAVFHRAIAGRGFQVTRCGELTVCLRPGRTRPRRETLAMQP